MPSARNFDDWISLYYDHALTADELREFDALLAASPTQAERFLDWFGNQPQSRKRMGAAKRFDLVGQQESKHGIMGRERDLGRVCSVLDRAFERLDLAEYGYREPCCSLTGGGQLDPSAA